MNEKIEFNEYQTPEYWMKRRARRAFITLVAFLILGYIEVGR